MAKSCTCNIRQFFFKFQSFEVAVPGSFKPVPEQDTGLPEQDTGFQDIMDLFAFFITEYFKAGHNGLPQYLILYI